jgi:phenylalanyl-tRNA synthetase beta chain
VHAILRALALFSQIGAGGTGAGIVDVYPSPPRARRVRLRRSRVAGLLGQEISDADVARLLERLAFKLTPTEDGFDVEVPTFRVDITREADLIEEVGRHWGFDRIPATLPPLREAPPARASGAAMEARLRGLSRGAGLQEAVTFTFIERAAAEPFLKSGQRPVAIANPLSEKFAVLRPSLLPGLLDALVYNRRREHQNVRLFEVGSVFEATGETNRIGWVLTGSRFEHWSGSAESVDFFDAKGIAELLLQPFGVNVDRVTMTPADGTPWFVRGRSAELRVDHPGRVIGHVGQLRPDIVAARGLDTGVVIGGELDLNTLAAVNGDAGGPAPPVQPIPRFPSVVRDLSIIVSERLPAAEVRGTIRSNAPSTLAAVGEFDRYQGKGVPDGHVSLSIRLTFRASDRTLTDSEVQRDVEAIVAALAATHGATLRGK